MTGTGASLADWVVIAPLLLCLIGGALLIVLRGLVKVQVWVCLAVIVLVIASDVALFLRVFAEGPLTMTMGNWLPPFGISFTADTTGAGFALASAFVTLCVVLYMQSDTPEGAVRDGVYPLVLLLLAGVSGSFLTGDLFNLYVWFELMLIASFGLMVLAGKPLQLDAAVKYGVLNFVGTTLFLMGLGLLYGALGTLNMADIVGAARNGDAAALTAIAALFVLAFGIKSATFPVNAWLPASYHAPPPAISALMGGLLTKVGAYALLRTLLMLLPEARETLAPVLMAVAVSTAVLGPLSAIAETHLRRSIGFLLIGGVGVMLLCLPSGDISAATGGLSYGFHAMLTFAALYMACGLVERATGQVDTRQMRGLYAANSLLSLVFIVLLLTVAGIPPFLGFWPKLLLLQGFVGIGDWLSLGALLLNALLTLIAGSRLWSHVFWRGTDQAVAPPAGAMAVTALLTLVIVAAGLAPGLMVAAAQLAAADMLNPARYIASVGLSP